MGYKKKMILICFFCAILLALESCGKTKTVVNEINIEDMPLLKSGIESKEDACVVYKADGWFYFLGVVPGEYVVFRDSIMKVKTIPNAEDAGATVSKMKKFEYWFCEVDTKEKLKVIDAKGKLEESSLAKEWKGYQLDHNTPVYFFENDPYINIWFTATPTKTSTEEENGKKIGFRLNLETEEMEKLEQEDMDQIVDYIIDDTSYYEYRWDMSIFRDLKMSGHEESWYNLWEIIGIPIYNLSDDEKGANITQTDNNGTARIEITTDYLPKQNEKLYAEFPELKEYIGKEGYIADIYLADYPSAEEIMSYLLEDGQEVPFEGAVLNGEDSIDGQSHEIHSFEAYYQWRKPIEEDKDEILNMID